MMIPTANHEQPDVKDPGLRFQLRYSIPLFIYGKGLSTEKSIQHTPEEISSTLLWQIVKEDNLFWLEIQNQGSMYVFLNGIHFNGVPQNSSMAGVELSGYILADSFMRWELPDNPPIPLSINAVTNNNIEITIEQRMG